MTVGLLSLLYFVLLQSQFVMANHGKDRSSPLNWICQEIVIYSVRVEMSIDDFLHGLHELALVSIRNTSLGDIL